jgi:hypothetical protein
MIVQAVGGLIVAVGLILFILDQRRPVSDERAEIKGWKIEMGGPASLILVVFGALIFLFPYSPWWSGDPEPPIAAAPENTFPDVEIGDALTIYADPPGEPISWWVEWSDFCESDALYWEPADDRADYWGVAIEVFDTELFSIDNWWIDVEEPFLCQWEWSYGEPGFTYWIWPRGINSAGEGDWIWIELVE